MLGSICLAKAGLEQACLGLSLGSKMPTMGPQIDLKYDLNGFGLGPIKNKIKAKLRFKIKLEVIENKHEK